MKRQEQLHKAAENMDAAAYAAERLYLYDAPEPCWRDNITRHIYRSIEALPPVELDRAIALIGVINCTKQDRLEVIDLQEWAAELREIAAALRLLANEHYYNTRGRGAPRRIAA